MDLLRPEKKRYSRLSGGCPIIITTGKKRYIHLSVGCVVLAIMTGKKRYSRLSGRCVIIITTGKKDTVVCLLGARFWRLRPEKKDTVVCLAGCAVVSVFGSGRKLAVFLLWREIFITTGKKRYSRLSGGCGIIITTRKKDTVVCLLGARFWRL